MKRILLLLVLLLCAAPAFAWGQHGHAIVNEAATLTLPNDMPRFFYEAFPELVWLGYDPDRWKGGGASTDAVNNPDHFLDLEFVQHLELPPDRFRFIALLHSSGTLRRKGIDLETSGFLPWRIAEVTERLTVLWRLWRASVPGSSERAFIERDIIHNAGILGHYAGDSANPHHTSIHHNAWLDPNPEKFATDCDVHTRFETQFVAHALVTADALPHVAAPKQIDEPFANAMERIRATNALIKMQYRLDRDQHFSIFGPVSPEGKRFAAERLGAGAAYLRDLWWSAWKNSAKPRRRG